MYKTYYMWWQQSLRDQSFFYSAWRKTEHIFKGRSQQEATNKMNRFLSMARITGRFLCVETGYKPIETSEGSNPIGRILESATKNNLAEGK